MKLQRLLQLRKQKIRILEIQAQKMRKVQKVVQKLQRPQMPQRQITQKKLHLQKPLHHFRQSSTQTDRP